MSAVKERVSGDTITLWLSRELEVVRRDLERVSDRSARTIIKNESLRVVLIGVRSGGEIREHAAEGPITIHVLEGSIDVDTTTASWTVGAGMLLSLGGGVRHSVSSSEGGIFLLTITQSPARFRVDDTQLDAIA
jgi:quercetin dioxygenase-like cupin family protein